MGKEKEQEKEQRREELKQRLLDVERDAALITASQAAKILHTSYGRLLDRIKRGETPFRRQGRAWVTSAAMLRRYADGEWQKKDE